jgi:AGCS family alanine or glycine:cation symporter
MWISAIFGMVTKYSEVVLAVKYREITPDGRVLGGPFYYIEKGLGRRWKPLAVIFAIFGTCVGVLGIGTLTQINGITSAVKRFVDLSLLSPDAVGVVNIFGVDYSWTIVISGAMVSVCVALVIIGGLKRIAAVSSVVVPFMAFLYVAICIVVLLVNITEIPNAIVLIIKAAFNPEAVTGGAVGTMFIAMQKGIARGIFSNEAGLGSAPIAAAATKTNEPARQGLVCMTGTFIDTIVICSMTGLVIVISGAWQPQLELKGVDMTIEAFRFGFGFMGPCGNFLSSFFLMISLTFFAFTTILGWNYYSEKCLEYLIGTGRRKIIAAFRVLYVAMVFAGPYLTVSAVWGIADVMNGLMAFPNLIALILLSPVVARVSREYFSK